MKSEIANALAAGKEVAVHEKDLSVSSWTGSGYIILDPDTGAGAYKIAGGANGGDTPLPSTLIGLGLGLLAGIAAIVMSTAILAAIAGAAGFLAVQLLNATYNTTEKIDFAGGRLIGMISGMGLAIILGQYVLFTLSPLFVIGLAILLLTILHLLILEIMTASNEIIHPPRRYA